MQRQARATSYSAVLRIENFDAIQARYHMLPLANRALAVISDAKPAFTGAQRIIKELAKEDKLDQAVKNLRSNATLISRMRSSEAKSDLLNDSIDFIQTADDKLTQWHKTLDMIARGSANATLATSKRSEQQCVLSVSGYLPLIKLIIIELAILNKEDADIYDSMLAETRRCATILSDCECASELDSVVLH